MLNPKAIEGLIKSSPEKRYRNFLNTVTDLEEVWLLCSEEGYATYDMDGIIHVLIWPRKEFCECFRSIDEKVVSIEIHDFLKYCKEIDNNIHFMVFPTNNDTYIVTLDQLYVDIMEHLDEIE